MPLWAAGGGHDAAVADATAQTAAADHSQAESDHGKEATHADVGATHGHHLGHVSPDLHEIRQMQNGLTLEVEVLLLQLALILAAAKLLGAIAEKINVPGVLGELGAGMLIGPYLLGHYIQIPVHGSMIPLFPPPGSVSEWPVSDALWWFAQTAAVVLLFMAGLHTNLKQFLRFVGPATIVAIGGVVVPFFFGAFATQFFSESVLGSPMSWTSPAALFMGAIMVATSVGITARVLTDIGRLDSPEGVTILAGAVVDDVLGILVLAVVSSIAASETSGAPMSSMALVMVLIKAVGFWLGLTFVGLALSSHIERFFNSIKYAGARLGLALALAFICSAVAEMFGLAFIIGAYSIGLGLSKTKMAHQLMEDLTPVNDFIVPVFFAVMGMLVNYQAMAAALVFGLVVSVLGIISKIVGCGLPALAVGFNKRGAWRIGLGMLPRGEVALIMAGVGLASGYIGAEIFGVAIMMTLVTTVIAPLGLVPAFRKGGSGLRKELPVGDDEQPSTDQQVEPVRLTMPVEMSRAFLAMFIDAARNKGYEPSFDEAERGIYMLRKNHDKNAVITINSQEGTLTADAPRESQGELHDILAQAEQQVTRCVQQITEVTGENQNILQHITSPPVSSS